MSLWAFFRRYIPQETARDYLFAALNNSARLNLIRSYLKTEADAAFVAAANEALLRFDICCENRNFIAHAMPHETPMTKKFSFLKRLPKEPGLLGFYDIPISDVREAAKSISECEEYIIGLLADQRLKEDGAPNAPAGLPPPPPKPRKLSLYRRPKAREDEQPPPPPSPQ
ncbi:MAG: hypothetical protein Q8L59_02595 [Phenylobacterium sp.]|nr:hypothetical protein [Phenylobacterium sp.]